MKVNIPLALASQVLTPSSQPALKKRYPTEPFSILAYGIASEGIKVFYSDGISIC
jgi:hypothetical protein